MEKFSKNVAVEATQVNNIVEAFALAEELDASSLNVRHYFYKDEQGQRQTETSVQMSGSPEKRFEVSFMYGHWVVKDANGRYRTYNDAAFKKEFEEYQQ